MTSNPTPRDHNKASVLEVVLSRAPLTRNEVIELTGLSKATVSRAVEELRADGFVADGGVDAATGRGRRSTYLDVPGTAGHVAGVSFGVLTTCVLVTDLRGREVHHVVVPTANHDDAGDAAEWLAGLIEETAGAGRGPLRQIVVAVPGRVRDGTEIFSPARSMKIFTGSGLHRAVADLVDAPVLLDSDANASLLAILAEDTSIGNAALFNLSSVLNFAGCTGHELARGRTPAFGGIGVLCAGAGQETLDDLMSTRGLLKFARGRGLGLKRVEDLWRGRRDDEAHAEVVAAFTTAIVTATSAVAVTLDPETVYFAGRLCPLVEEVLPEVRSRLGRILPAAPEVKVVTQVVGLSTARGAVFACLALTQERLRDAALGARGRRTEQSTPAF
ncbi:ROK family transcriptional regulator [Amycolatopsis balhimycina]|uniref:ROK family transcriptional regulator n=1 Tax=Amycolatopsis balhimycina TaxID=208443 RepID=UPI00036ADFDC|nr:ROK family transcriptional regulator [Amycolatopsis balhimycina]